MIVVLAVTVVLLAYAVGTLWIRLDRLTAAIAALITAHNLSIEAVKTIASADLANFKVLSQSMSTLGADVAELAQRMEGR